MTCSRIHPPAANDEGMLLCDGCDGGYHLFCLRPKLASIPDGSWFCTDCASEHDKATVAQPLTSAAAGQMLGQAVESRAFWTAAEDADLARLREQHDADCPGLPGAVRRPECVPQ